MASERGTMQRGLGPGDQQGWAPEPTAPAGRRLPTPSRERKPALAALALVLIVGGALGAGFLVLRSGQRVPAIEVTQQVGAGEKIPRSALQEVQVAADTGVQYVDWAYAQNVAQDYAATMIPAGTLLSKAMVAPAGSVLSGREVLGLALKDGQWPSQLTVGDHVAIYATSGQNGSSNGSSGCRNGGTLTLANDASVVSVTTGSSSGLVASGQSGSADVTVAVSPADAGVVACYAAAGQVAVALLPPGSHAPSVSQPASSPPATVPGSGTGQPAPGKSRKLSTSPSPTVRPSHG